MKPAVRLDKVSKRFEHILPRYNTLLGRLRRLGGVGASDTWALREISLEVARGECLGISGPNGAGKTTLLALVAGILEPTSGTVDVDGRTNAFLSLHEGLQPELSVRDNIEICGILMGLRRREVLKRMDAILDFAELADRAEFRMAELSAGQTARVAFATAMNSDIDIFLVDEALAVGDAAFQAKCQSAFERLRREGKTALLASHEESLLERFCTRRLRLAGGRSQESSKRILFIGNSLTSFERADVPGSLRELRAGVETEMVVESGETLEGHWRTGRALKAIRSRAWDFVVLQDESSRPIADAPSFRRYAGLFDEEIKRAGARTVLFSTWARRGQPHVQLRVDEQYRELAGELGAVLAPVGAEWAKAMREDPSLELYAPDHNHASPAGSRLAARVVSETLFDRV